MSGDLARCWWACPNGAPRLPYRDVWPYWNSVSERFLAPMIRANDQSIPKKAAALCPTALLMPARAQQFGAVLRTDSKL